MLKFEHQEDKHYSQWEQMSMLKKLYVYTYIKIRKLMQNNKKSIWYALQFLVIV